MPCAHRPTVLPALVLQCALLTACFGSTPPASPDLVETEAPFTEHVSQSSNTTAQPLAESIGHARAAAELRVHDAVLRAGLAPPDCVNVHAVLRDNDALQQLALDALRRVSPTSDLARARLQVHVRLIRRAPGGVCHTEAGVVRGPAFYHAASLAKLPAAIGVLSVLEQDFGPNWEAALHRPLRLVPRTVQTSRGTVRLEGTRTPATLVQWLEAALIVSDNPPYNHLLDVVGTARLNALLADAGYGAMHLQGRFDQGSRPRHATHLHPAVEWLDNNTATPWQPARLDDPPAIALPDDGTQVGRAHITWRTRERVEAPWDLSYTNRIPADAITDLMLNLVVPDADGPDGDLPLGDAARAQLLTWLAAEPPPLAPYTRAQRHAAFQPVLPGVWQALGVPSPYPVVTNPDTHRSTNSDAPPETPWNTPLDARLRPANVLGKVGWSFGFFSWVGAVQPLGDADWLIVGVAIYANRNDVINDGRYDYETLARPWIIEVARLLTHAAWPTDSAKGSATLLAAHVQQQASQTAASRSANRSAR